MNPGPVIIKCDKKPFIPEKWILRSHNTDPGKVTWDPYKVIHYLAERQLFGIDPVSLEIDLRGKLVYNACVLDWLLKNMQYVPKFMQYDGIRRFFWGTIYFNSGNLSSAVRCLVNDRWDWAPVGDTFDPDFYSSMPALLQPELTTVI